MCLPKPKAPVDNSGEIARQQEEARQAKIREGQALIDSSFDTTFNDDYFGARAQEYEDYYNPQLLTQFEDAKKQLTFNAARSGNAESTDANEQFARLEKARADAATKIANDALATTGKLKSDVASQRSNLYTLNNSAADPTQSAAQAQAAVTQLQQPTSYSPLGSVFASLIQSGGNAAAVRQATTAPGYGSIGPQAPTGSTNNGSGRVVN
jgi:hypothetical protein